MQRTTVSLHAAFIDVKDIAGMAGSMHIDH